MVSTSTFSAWETSTGSLALLEALLTPNPNITVDPSSFKHQLGYAPDPDTGRILNSIGFYNGSIPGVNIDAGLILSTGSSEPPLQNTVKDGNSGVGFHDGYSVALLPENYSDDADLDQFNISDSDLLNSAKIAFPEATDVYDATYISFNFTANDPSVKKISLDLVFATEEFPEYSSSKFTDIAAVYLNGKNIAVFDNNQLKPLSVIDANVNSGYFRNNLDSSINIEYDGISKLLTIYAPINSGVNTLKIGVADTGDKIYDSALFVSNLSGISSSNSNSPNLISYTDQNDNIVGSSSDDNVDAKAGDDFITSSSGNDTYYGGIGFDIFHTNYSRKSTTFKQGLDGSLVLSFPDGRSALYGFEKISFTDGSLIFDLPSSATNDLVYRLYKAAFARSPDEGGFRFWVSKAEQGYTLPDMSAYFRTSPEFSEKYGSNLSVVEYVEQLYKNVLGRLGETAGFDYWCAELNTSHRTEANVLFEFSRSPENVTNTLYNVDNGYWVV